MHTELRELRARHPELIAERAAKRTRRPLLPDDGRLMIIAADRDDLLDRLVTALSNPKTDGVLATADIVEDLLLLGALEDKVVFGSMNRGGLRGTTFEMDDRFTGYDASTIAQLSLDGGKMLLRIDPDDHGTARTLEATSRAVTELAALGKIAMIEPFIMERVVRATTLPVLLLGGESADALGQLRRAAALPGVRGLVAGRALLYPADGDVESAVAAACDMVHS